MPSKSYVKFEKRLLVDVERIISSHAVLNHDGGGRRGLGHLTRSGVLMLCAAWQVYVEEVLEESASYLLDSVADPKNLPLVVQKELSMAVKTSKHELKPLDVAGSGWVNVYLEILINTLKGFNTPKLENIDNVFEKFLGVEAVSLWWGEDGGKIDKFVVARGDVAHKGRDARYVTITNLKEYLVLITNASLSLDNGLTDYLFNELPSSNRPWRKRTI